MKNGTSVGKKLGLTLLLVPMAFLPGCALMDWMSGKSSSTGSSEKASQSSTVLGGDVLASIDGKPLITAESLDEDFNQLLEENPQLKAVLPLMPDAKYNFLMGMISQAVVDKYIEDKQLDKTAEYQKELGNMMKSVKRMLNAKYFGVEHPVKVSDSEVKKFYEENKEAMPDLLISRGGVKAMGVPFAKEADAKAFLAKAKAQDFGSAAAQSGLKDKVTDFKLVNNQSIGMDAALRDKVVSMKKFPAVELVKGSDNNYWVVAATGAEEAKYRPFEQVEAGLKQFVEKEKRMEIFDKEINKLKEQYHITVNEDYFKKQQEDGGEQQVSALMQQGAKMAESNQAQSSPKAAKSA